MGGEERLRGRAGGISWGQDSMNSHAKALTRVFVFALSVNVATRQSASIRLNARQDTHETHSRSPLGPRPM